MRSLVKNTNVSCLILAVLLSITPLILFYAGGRYVSGGDGVYFYYWVKDFFNSLEQGIFYPRWAYDTFGGLGGPVFTYYAPLYFYVSSLFSYLTGDYFSGMQIADIFGSLLLGISGFFISSKLQLKNSHTLLFVVLLTLNPFQLATLLYVQGHPWNFTYAFILLLLFTLSYLEYGPQKIIIIVFLTSCIFFTHLLTGVMVILCLAISAIFLFIGKVISSKTLFFDAAGVILGVALAAIYWLPAIGYMNLMNQDGYSNDVKWDLGFTFPIFHDTRWALFQYIIAGGILSSIIFSAAMLRHVSLSKRKCFLVLLAIAAVSFLMSTEFMYFLWDRFSFFRKFQYAYRFFCVSSISSIVLLFIVLNDLSKVKIFIAAKLCLAIISFNILLGGVILLKCYFIDAKNDVDAFNKNLAIHGQRAFYTRDAKSLAMISSEGLLDEVICMGHSVICKAKHNGRVYRWDVESSSRSQVLLPVYSFPAWTVTVDGANKDIVTDYATGLISIELKSGTHIIKLQWGGSLYYTIGTVISIITVLIICVFYLFFTLRRRHMVRLTSTTTFTRN